MSICNIFCGFLQKKFTFVRKISVYYFVKQEFQRLPHFRRRLHQPGERLPVDRKVFQRETAGRREGFRTGENSAPFAAASGAFRSFRRVIADVGQADIPDGFQTVFSEQPAHRLIRIAERNVVIPYNGADPLPQCVAAFQPAEDILCDIRTDGGVTVEVTLAVLAERESLRLPDIVEQHSLPAEISAAFCADITQCS